MKCNRRGDTDVGGLEFVVGFVFGAVLCGVFFHGVGYELGVKDHANGKAVIDTLSNGDTVITKVEKKEPR